MSVPPSVAPARPFYASAMPLSTSSSSAPMTTPTSRKTVRFQATHVHADDSVRRSSNGGTSEAAAAAATSNVTPTSSLATTTITSSSIVRPTLLQPRVAVVLGVPGRWHLPLFACRLLSVVPAIWWSLGILIRLLIQLHALLLAHGNFGSGGGGDGEPPKPGGQGVGGSHGLSLESRLKLTETALAMIWVSDVWLLNYTPQATIVRLLAINALYGYLTSWVIYLAGSNRDSRLLLPAWVSIAATLTALYHVTQRKINIRKETSISISVFSGASFISMVSLLAQLYWDRPEYADVPVISIAYCVCTEVARIAGNLFDIGNITMDL
ncbi:hypothetical protein CMQ_3063 [Grosmannia clavigera kw1407]|uniref:N-glycosylation protein EOS1 n=1 Tax=Grosmannia clavigera (strain kw1407 / UAMH 11150) TaxID=655863 RepID=F0XHP4_GROCL|nr:uncharacterized protein CMQ_3063 [Grosmannia clavigera kw1407]EFX03134.1 hypothetical protein CMQ_3063 [Grosmannia clavigera kw1407]